MKNLPDTGRRNVLHDTLQPFLLILSTLKGGQQSTEEIFLCSAHHQCPLMLAAPSFRVARILEGEMEQYMELCTTELHEQFYPPQKLATWIILVKIHTWGRSFQFPVGENYLGGAFVYYPLILEKYKIKEEQRPNVHCWLFCFKFAHLLHLRMNASDEVKEYDIFRLHFVTLFEMIFPFRYRFQFSTYKKIHSIWIQKQLFITCLIVSF